MQRQESLFVVGAPTRLDPECLRIECIAVPTGYTPETLQYYMPNILCAVHAISAHEAERIFAALQNIPIERGHRKQAIRLIRASIERILKQLRNA